MVESRPVKHARPRPLEGLKVVELAEEMGVYAGKLLADAGAMVLKVEPPGGSEMRRWGPFVDDKPGPDRSLYFAFYNTSKQSVVLDLETAAGKESLRRLIDEADIVIDGLGRGKLTSLGMDYESLKASNRGLILVAMTPYGQEGPWADFKSSDLVALAMAGVLNCCGYDDHSIPPIRGGGNQAYNTASHQAVIAILIALMWRRKTGEGQFVDLSMHDACSAMVEFANLYWWYNKALVQRQTCRHAMPVRTQPTHLRCADGRYVVGALAINDPKVWNGMKGFLEEKGLLTDLGDPAYDDPNYRREQSGHIQEVIESLAAICTADEYYHRGQSFGMVVGVVRAPEDVAEDPHLKARGFWEEIDCDEWGRPVRFPGAPYRFSAMECWPSCPPGLGVS